MSSSVRLRNVLSLYQAFVQERVASGESPVGLERAFAVHLEISASLWSQIKSGRTVGDKLARQIESKFVLDSGWLDVERASTSSDPAEEQFIALCRRAWTDADRVGRAELKRFLSNHRPTS